MIDKKSFSEAYDTYADAIYKHCFLHIFSKTRAEDLMQETFLRAWRYAEEGHDIRNLRALLYRIATHLIIDEKRKKKEESLDALLATSDAYEPSFDERAENDKRIFFGETFAKLKLLEEEERSIIVMRYVDDLEPREIAALIGTSANSVSVRLHRALAKLRNILEQQ